MRTATLILVALFTTLLLTSLARASETDISTSTTDSNGRFPVGEPDTGRVPVETPPAFRLIGDLNADGQVDGLDVSVLLSFWGTCGTVLSTSDAEICTGDLNHDNQVNFDDLVILLSAWN